MLGASPAAARPAVHSARLDARLTPAMLDLLSGFLPHATPPAPAGVAGCAPGCAVKGRDGAAVATVEQALQLYLWVRCWQRDARGGPWI